MNRWFVWRLGLVRFGTSILVILLSGVLNRVLITDYAVSASIITMVFSVQNMVSPIGILSGRVSDTRPVWGYSRSPYILGGMLLCIGVMPAFPYMAKSFENNHSFSAVIFGVVLFGLFGLGSTVSATAVNSLLVDRVDKEYRGEALTAVWIMTLLGFLAGSLIFLEIIPTHSWDHLFMAFNLGAGIVLILTITGLVGIEKRNLQKTRQEHDPSLRIACRSIVKNKVAVWFFLFLAASNFFFFIQEYVLEPFGGDVLKLEVYQTTGFNFYWSFGVLIGMTAFAALAYTLESLDGKKISGIGCLVGGLSFFILTYSSVTKNDLVISNAVLLMGLSKGIYNVGLSHLTMTMVHQKNSGLFMGLWNFISGLALALGGLMGGPLKDIGQFLTGRLNLSYGLVFLVEAVGLLGCLYILSKINSQLYWTGDETILQENAPT